MTIRHTTLLALASTVACAAPGTPPAESVTRVGVTSQIGNMGITELHTEPGRAAHALPLPVDSVWRALPRVYEMLGIAEARAVPDERLFGARNFRPRRIEGNRLSQYIDCGMGATATPKADEYDVTMTLVSEVQPAGDAGTTLETLLQASGRPRAAAGNRVSCQSNGTLEKRIAELVAWVLLPGS
jgi:hypothetical protein